MKDTCVSCLELDAVDRPRLFNGPTLLVLLFADYPKYWVNRSGLL